MAATDNPTAPIDFGAFTEVADGLLFPEGPVALPDGSIVVVEMFGECVTRIDGDGRKHRVASVPGGPNGAALGADGALYLCNNGGSYTPVTMAGLLLPGPFDPKRYSGGRIQRLDLETGRLDDLYTHCDGRPLRSPNDLVFDGHGGFYFSDHGIRDHATRLSDLTGIYYARADGSVIMEVAFPAEAPNGIGLSPDGSRLYWAETHTARVMQRQLTAPGVLAPVSLLDPGVCLARLPGMQLLDSLAVDGLGQVCVATLLNGGITVIALDGSLRHLPTGDPVTTNLCFADGDGSGEYRDTYVTLAGTGRLLHTRWPWPGLRLQPR